jgi:hypothetical protein
MLRDRRQFVTWLAAFCASTGFLDAAQRPHGQSPRSDPHQRDESAPAAPPTKAVLKENEKDIKKDIEKLYQLASELKAEVEKTDSSQVLSLPMIRKAEEIEKLARGIKNRAKG